MSKYDECRDDFRSAMIHNQEKRIKEKDAEIAALRGAIKDFLCECALVDKFRRYETWQITPWSMDELMKMVEEEP